MKHGYVVFHLLAISCLAQCQRNPFLVTEEEAKYASITEEDLRYARSKTREMFYFGYNNYMTYAYPMDELDPINCRGRGADHANPENINVNDVLGDYSLTLVDTLDSLVVFGDSEEFKRAVDLVIRNVNFEKNTTVQVFEATIRIMGSLISAHSIAIDKSRKFGDFFIENYDGQLLKMALDLADRLLPAFEGTLTGLPYTRINLERGVLPGTTNWTCTAGAGSLLLEFGMLSKFSKNSTFEEAARKVNRALWNLRDATTGLHGNLVDIQTGQWMGHLSGLGAGIDSYYELMLKAYVIFGREEDWKMFEESMKSVWKYMRKGRSNCTSKIGDIRIFLNVDSRDGNTLNTWIDSLQASFAAVLVMAGRVDEAVCHHALYYAIWRKYGVLPERFNWHLKQPDVKFYPLRPEFAESTYFLYMATKNPFYLNVGLEILESLDEITRVKCGFATVHDVLDGSLEDRMESFFLSETMKYLYLLFDIDNPINRNFEKIVFSTEGHIFPILGNDDDELNGRLNKSCKMYNEFEAGVPPLRHSHMAQLLDVIGVEDHSWV